MENKKRTPKNEVVKDYFKLPFEVFYSGPVGVITYELKSDIPIKRFKDVKVAHMEQGRAWGVLFTCSKNNGPELYCCLKNLHDEVTPEWLSLESEEDIRFNYGCDYQVKVDGEKIRFTQEIDDADEMEYCCDYAFLEYELDSARPDFIVLDAEDSRMKIDLEGFVLDEAGNRVKGKKLFELDESDEEKLSDYSSRELWEAKAEWIKQIIETQFPRDKKLQLAFKTL